MAKQHSLPDEHDLAKASETFFALADYVEREYPFAKREINCLREAAEYGQQWSHNIEEE